VTVDPIDLQCVFLCWLIIFLKLTHFLFQIGAAPPPPPYPEGYVPPSAEQEKAPDDVAASEAPPQLDPILDQGPSKRPRFQ